MPSIQLPLISYEELISEPIKKQIGARIGGDINYVNSAGNKLTNSDGIDLSNEEEAKLVISEEDWVDSTYANNLTAANTRYCLIEDKDINLSVKLADMDKEFIINITKRFATRADAIWWRNSIIGNLRDGTSNTVADINISPCIPNNILTLIEECRLRKKKRGREDRSFMEYLLGISRDTISLDTNSTKSNVAVNFPEKLDNLIFSLPSTPPNPVLEEGKYILELEIKTIIRIPTAVVLTYPNFIGGYLLPKEMVDMTVDVNMDPEHNAEGPREILLDFKGRSRAHYKPYCYQLPAFEYYKFPMSKWNLSPIFQIRVSADKKDPHLVANINDLFKGPISGYSLDPELLRYIVEHRTEVTNPNNTIISVILMKGGIMVTPNLVYLDEYLNLRTKYELDSIGDYHLVIATPMQTASVPVHMIDTVEEYPDLLNKLIKHTNPAVYTSKLPQPTKVTTEVYRKVFDDLLKGPKMTSAITANTLVVNANLL